jgi:hypothetical protein
MEKYDDDGEEEAASGINFCFFFTHYYLGRNTPITTPLLVDVCLTS